MKSKILIGLLIIALVGCINQDATEYLKNCEDTCISKIIRSPVNEPVEIEGHSLTYIDDGKNGVVLVDGNLPHSQIIWIINPLFGPHSFSFYEGVDPEGICAFVIWEITSTTYVGVCKGKIKDYNQLLWIVFSNCIRTENCCENTYVENRTHSGNVFDGCCKCEKILLNIEIRLTQEKEVEE